MNISLQSRKTRSLRITKNLRQSSG